MSLVWVRISLFCASSVQPAVGQKIVLYTSSVQPAVGQKIVLYTLSVQIGVGQN